MSNFIDPYYLFLLPVCIAYGVGLYWRRKKRYASVRISNLQYVMNEPSWRTLLYQWLLPALRIMALGCMVVALARPQETLREQRIKAEGIDIMLSFDISVSMLARDFNPDRLTASKAVAKDFVLRREFDRIGLVVFSGEAFTQCPLTTDHNIINHFLDNLRSGLLIDGTAIGMGLATAVNHIKDSPTKSKVIILLTDGVNNAGYIQPNIAADLAQTFGIKVYTIGIGTSGRAFAPVERRGFDDYIFSYVPVEIDEQLLLGIAQKTGGRYFRAKDEKSLQKIYAEIDKLERTEIETTAIQRDIDLFPQWLWAAFVLLLLEIALRWTVLRTVV